ncbi:hypothetical protein PRIPAC_83864 [Pristionchus pacificus]|uniref:Uncharacterized protein n=1 Tax=Pristionchus pacificus TaxID=54126 RepID=A0A2A6BN17_PRIPA|nr:hypothetical protein PRIPAC_83864 [Pristionchus pacificus]|eukprot:PDM67310.1 hypothetical protein PRIPAC_48727 [Pristionchus pacificus]
MPIRHYGDMEEYAKSNGDWWIHESVRKWGVTTAAPKTRNENITPRQKKGATTRRDGGVKADRETEEEAKIETGKYHKPDPNCAHCAPSLLSSEETWGRAMAKGRCALERAEVLSERRDQREMAVVSPLYVLSRRSERRETMQFGETEDELIAMSEQ